MNIPEATTDTPIIRGRKRLQGAISRLTEAAMQYDQINTVVFLHRASCTVPNCECEHAANVAMQQHSEALVVAAKEIAEAASAVALLHMPAPVAAAAAN